MDLIPINEHIADNKEFTDDPLCQETIYITISFFKKVGYKKPWISYYARKNDCLVGCGAFKGAPKDGVVEIAYGTFEPFRQKGVGSEICKQLVDLSLKTDPSVTITARTLPEKNFSTRILQKNGFVFSATVNDPEDGDVWEWVYPKNK
jgi:ribosomal-protein-alanine N-acetyltransferase